MKVMRAILNWAILITSIAIISLNESFQIEIINLFYSVFNGFQIEFSLPHLISVVALILLLIFVYHRTWNEFPRVKNSLQFEKSFYIKSSILGIIIVIVGMIIYH